MEVDFNHDLMLSIHSYYVDEFSVGIRASERLLNSNISADIKLAASKNLSFYIKPVSAYFDVKYTHLKTDDVTPGWCLFNPTILPYEGGFLSLVRSSNYKIDNAGYYIPAEEDCGLIRTSYYKFVLDNNLNIKSTSKVTDASYEKTNYPVDGLEDLRIFDVGSCLFVSGTIRNAAPYDGNCRIALSKYDPVSNSLGSPRIVETDLFHEKNWMPIVGSNKITWLHHPNLNSLSSIIYLDEDNEFKLHYNDCNMPIAEGFRGGSQLFPLGNKYYSVVHEVTTKENNKRIYYHRFLEWDADLRLVRRSRAFYLKGDRTIEFAAGLSIKDNLVHVSFGLNDLEAWIATFSLENMLSLFFLDGKPV